MACYHCCATGCNSNSKKLLNLAKYPWMKSITFHSFPHLTRKRKLREKWTEMVRRGDNWTPNKRSRLCSVHFVGLKGPTAEHPIPTQFAYNEYGGLLGENYRRKQLAASANINNLRACFPAGVPAGCSDEMECDEPVSKEKFTPDRAVPLFITEVRYTEPPGETLIKVEDIKEENIDDSVSDTESNVSLPDIESNVSLPYTESTLSASGAEDALFASDTESNVFVPDTESNVSVLDTESNVFVPDPASTTEWLSPSTDHSYTCSAAPRASSPAPSPPPACMSQQTEMTAADIQHVLEENKRLKEVLADEDRLCRSSFMAKILKSDAKLKSYTGIPNIAVFNALYALIEDKTDKLIYWKGKSTAKDVSYATGKRKKPGRKRKLSEKEEFVMTMVRLRTGLHTMVLADLFGVSEGQVSSTFTTWINFLRQNFKTLIKWTSDGEPAPWKNQNPNTRAIIDCTEFFTDTPDTAAKAKSVTYSSYKSNHIVKALAAGPPT